MKYILFDLDDTLFDFKKAEKIALTKTLESFGIAPDEKILSRYSEINISRWKLMELRKITREEVKVSRYRILFDEFGIAVPPENATPVYEKNLAIGHYFMEGAEDVIKKLYGSYRLYIVSNGTSHVQKGRIESSIIPRYFDGIFISQNIGYNKPDVRFFEHCFESIDGFSKDQSVIIGDSLSSDIQGGINAGITTVWFNPKGDAADKIKPDYEITSLYQIPKLLENI